MILKAEGISRRYFRKNGEANFFEAVQRTDLTLRGGELSVLMGRSGSGKTTLLHMLAGLLTPSEGRVLLEETDLYTLEDGKLSRLRNESIGVIPQARSAVETLTVRENILLPGLLYGRESKEQEDAARSWMEKLGIGNLADSSPRELSGGELRRMAIARALCGGAGVILADEPTGDLDDENTLRVLEILKAQAREGKAVFIVTHENEARGWADHVYRMDGGKLTEE